jgi:hypothetical protein
MKKPVPPPNLPSTTSIFIAGTASAYVILSNLAPTVSVEDIKVTLAGIGGGVKEVHIISSTGQGLQVKVAFRKPEGGRECIAKFNGIKADGTLPIDNVNDQVEQFLPLLKNLLLRRKRINLLVS